MYISDRQKPAAEWQSPYLFGKSSRGILGTLNHGPLGTPPSLWQTSYALLVNVTHRNNPHGRRTRDLLITSLMLNAWQHIITCTCTNTNWMKPTYVFAASLVCGRNASLLEFHQKISGPSTSRFHKLVCNHTVIKHHNKVRYRKSHI